MLFEMATGNLSYRLLEENKNDGLGELITILNKLARRMQSVFIEHDHVVPAYTYQSIVQMVLVLDEQFMIKNCSPATVQLLGYTPEALYEQTGVMALIAPASKDLWQTLSAELLERSHFHTSLRLIFQTSDQLLLPLYCTVTKLHPNGSILITSVTTVLEDLLYDLQIGKANKRAKDYNAETLQQLHDHILDNIGTPLPTIIQLSQQFRLNEFDVKHGFKELFGTSIHQFYNDARLQRAHLMISRGDQVLKEIAFANGFNGYLNFYKAFKKKFGYTPSELCRTSGQRQP